MCGELLKRLKLSLLLRGQLDFLNYFSLLTLGRGCLNFLDSLCLKALFFLKRRVRTSKFEFFDCQKAQLARSRAVVGELADICGIMESSNPIFAVELLLYFLHLCLVLALVVDGGVTGSTNSIILIVLIAQKFLFNKEKTLDCDLDLGHVLSATSAKLPEVISSTRKVLQPQAQLDGASSDL